MMRLNTLLRQTARPLARSTGRPVPRLTVSSSPWRGFLTYPQQNGLDMDGPCPEALAEQKLFTELLEAKKAGKDTKAIEEQILALQPADEPPTTLMELVNHYGAWPFFGSLGLLAISNEYLLMNEEFLLATNFTAFAITAYVFLGDTVNTMVKEENDDLLSQAEKLQALELVTLEKMIESRMVMKYKAPMLREVAKAVVESDQKSAVAHNLKLRHEYVASVKNMLDAKLSTEKAVAAEQLGKDVENEIAFMVETFKKAEQQQKDAYTKFRMAQWLGQDAGENPLVKMMKK